MKKNNSSFYDYFFGSSYSEQYLDLKKRFDADFQSVILDGYDFSRDEWFCSTVAAALNSYLNEVKK